MSERTYAVVSGWITRYRFGDGIEECRGDDDGAWCYDTEDEAREKFNAVAAGLALDYRVERQCAGRAWSERDAYAELQAWDEGADGWLVAVEVLDEARYGLEDWERDHPEA